MAMVTEKARYVENDKFVPEELVRATMAKRFGRMATKILDSGIPMPNVTQLIIECDEAKRKFVTDFIHSATPAEIIKAASRINSTMNR
jgi:hypothetical protein